VFTCDHLAFSGEVKINRKHTRYADSDLRRLTCAVGRLGDKFAGLDKRIDAYRDEPVQDWRVRDLIICAVDCRAITTSQVPDVVQEWREPSHRERRPRNLWSGALGLMCRGAWLARCGCDGRDPRYPSRGRT
jgi:hypothetical protein